MTTHKLKALYLLVGFFLGCLVTHYMVGPIMAYKVQNAFDIGMETGLQFQIEHQDSSEFKINYNNQ